MTIQDYIAAYAEGWTLGDSEKIMSAVSPTIVLDDPNVGKVTHDALPDYIAGLKNAINTSKAHWLKIATELLSLHNTHQDQCATHIESLINTSHL